MTPGVAGGQDWSLPTQQMVRGTEAPGSLHRRPLGAFERGSVHQPSPPTSLPVLGFSPFLAPGPPARGHGASPWTSRSSTPPLAETFCHPLMNVAPSKYGLGAARMGTPRPPAGSKARKKCRLLPRRSPETSLGTFGNGIQNK